MGGPYHGCDSSREQGKTLEEIDDNLEEAIALILDDGAPAMSNEFIGTQVVVVA